MFSTLHTQFNTKRFILFTALIMLCMLFVPLFFTDAQSALVPQQNSKWIPSSLTSWVATEVVSGITQIFIWVNTGIVYLVTLAAFILKVSINVAMAPLQGVNAIQIGWVVTRDVANVFFIFILLTIAIGIILRLDNYGSRALLVRLIIVALLINFSLVIAQVVIDASNVLGITFINKVYPVDVKLAASLRMGGIWSAGSNDATPPPKETTLQVAPNTIQAIQNSSGSISTKTTGGTLGSTQLALGTAPQIDEQFSSSAALLFIQILVFFLQILALFVFLGLAILYLIRTVALIIILILAPFGFLFLVLPSTRGYAMQWWHNLFSYSFFFPISAFFIYIAVLWGYQMGNQLTTSGAQVTDSGYVFSYLSTVLLLFAGLKISRNMGIYGASAVLSRSEKIAKGMRGAAGRVITRNAAPVASRINTSPSVLASAVRSIPFAQRGLQRVSSAERENIKDQEKGIERYTSRELTQRFGKYGTSSTERAAILRTLGKRGDISFGEGGLSRNLVTRTMEQMRNVGQSVKDVQRVDPTLIERREGESLTAAMRRLNIKVRPEDIPNMDDEVRENPEVVRSIIDTSSPEIAQAFIAQAGKPYQVFVGELQKIAAASGGAANNINSLVEGLKSINPALGQRIRGAPGLASSLGFEASNTEKSQSDNSGTQGPSLITPPSGFGGGSKTPGTSGNP